MARCQICDMSVLRCSYDQAVECPKRCLMQRLLEHLDRKFKENKEKRNLDCSRFIPCECSARRVNDSTLPGHGRLEVGFVTLAFQQTTTKHYNGSVQKLFTSSEAVQPIIEHVRDARDADSSPPATSPALADAPQDAWVASSFGRVQAGKAAWRAADKKSRTATLHLHALDSQTLVRIFTPLSELCKTTTTLTLSLSHKIRRQVPTWSPYQTSTSAEAASQSMQGRASAVR